MPTNGRADGALPQHRDCLKCCSLSLGDGGAAPSAPQSCFTRTTRTSRRAKSCESQDRFRDLKRLKSRSHLPSLRHQGSLPAPRAPLAPLSPLGITARSGGHGGVLGEPAAALLWGWGATCSPRAGLVGGFRAGSRAREGRERLNFLYYLLNRRRDCKWGNNPIWFVQSIW